MAEGLRERKKQQTRQRIAEAAMGLFVAQGFDETTVAQIAAEADVAVKTVFNYFPAKEDLFFDRPDEVETQWREAVADRRPDESVLAGLRRRALARFADDPGVHFLRVMAGSPLLQARGQQMWAAHEDAVTEELAALLGVAADDSTPRVLAHQTFNVHPLALRMVERWAREGAPAEEVRRRALELINRAFDVLEHGISAR